MKEFKETFEHLKCELNKISLEIEEALARINAVKEEKKEVDFSILNDNDVFFIYSAMKDIKGRFVFKGINPFTEKVKNIDLDVEDSYGVQRLCDKENVLELRLATPEESELFYKHFPEEKDNFPKTWEGLEELSGIYLDINGKMHEAYNYKTNNLNKSITPTQKEAESYLSACQLRQLAKVINDNQTEDEWVDLSTLKIKKYYPLYNHINNQFEIKINMWRNFNGIYFKRKEDLERSLIEHKDLWLTYFKVSNND